MKSQIFLPVLLVLVFALIGCATNSNIRDKYQPSSNEFSVAQTGSCSKICWLGIEPDVTTENEALELIKKSNSVDQSSIRQADDRIKLTWFTDESKTITGYAELVLSSGLVHSIALRQLTPFTVNDFIGILGPPNEIGISAWDGVHGEKFTTYSLYFTSLDAMIQVSTGSMNGPQPDDFVDWVGMNLVLDEGTHRHLWLGYGHLDEYLSTESPSATTTTPTTSLP